MIDIIIFIFAYLLAYHILFVSSDQFLSMTVMFKIIIHWYNIYLQLSLCALSEKRDFFYQIFYLSQIFS